MNEPLPLTPTRLESLLADCVDFAQRLIQTPSMPGEEGAIARLIAAELERLAFDRVWLDGAGNVCGRIAGREPGLPALVLNSHIDHVDPGDPALWPVPPYSGEIVDGHIVGRGASDIKGPLAVQVYALGAVAGSPSDVVFTCRERGSAHGPLKETRDYDGCCSAVATTWRWAKHDAVLVRFHGRSHAGATALEPQYALCDSPAAAGAGAGWPAADRTTVAPTVDTSYNDARVVQRWSTMHQSLASLAARSRGGGQCRTALRSTPATAAGGRRTPP